MLLLVLLFALVCASAGECQRCNSAININLAESAFALVNKSLTSCANFLLRRRVPDHAARSSKFADPQINGETMHGLQNIVRDLNEEAFEESCDTSVLRFYIHKVFKKCYY